MKIAAVGVLGPGAGVPLAAHDGDAGGRAPGDDHVHQKRGADPPAEVPGLPSAGLDRPDAAHHLRGRARVCADKIKRKVSQRLMPPWHIDRTIGIQEFKNDRSLSDEQIATLVALGGRRHAAGRSEGHAAAGEVPGSAGLAVREGVRRARSRDQVGAATRWPRRRRTSGSGR